MLLDALHWAVIAEATANPWAFDRTRYDHLMGLWEALVAEPEGPV